MDSVYEINIAKTEFRNAYNSGDVDRLVGMYHDSAVHMAESLPSKFGAAGKAYLRERAAELFAQYSVHFVPIIIDILPCGDKMLDYGWHEFTLTPKASGGVIRTRQRYVELWSKNRAGEWKIWFHMNNGDIRNEFNGMQSTWFLDQQPLPASA